MHRQHLPTNAVAKIKQGSEILTNAIMGEKVFSEQNFLQEGMEELGSLIGGQIGGEKGAAIGNALGNVMYIAQDLLTGFMAEANFYEYLDKLNDGNKALSIKEILEEAGYSTDVDDVEETLQDILNRNGIKSSLTEEEIKACEEAGLMMKADDAGKVDDVLDVLQEGGLNSSKYMEQLDNFSENKINHMINGSKNSNHGWEKLVPDKNWNDIKNIVSNVMENGVEGSYNSVFSKKMTINGYEVEVTYNKLVDGTIKISDAWINP